MIHTMRLVSDVEGTQEWLCLECGRVLLIEWQPYRKIVAVPGDETAQHHGGTGGLEMGGVEIQPAGDS